MHGNNTQIFAKIGKKIMSLKEIDIWLHFMLIKFLFLVFLEAPQRGDGYVPSGIMATIHNGTVAPQ